MSVEPNTADALSFLRRWPARSLQLTAIHIDAETKEKGLIESRSFDKDTDLDDDGAVEKWVNDRQGRANIYFSINTLKDKRLNKRAHKTDIGEVVAFHIDVDVPPGEDQDAVAAKLVEDLKQFPLEPSALVMSGGGVQAFWILQPSDYITIDGDITKANGAECYTRGLEAAVAEFLGTKADATFNVDRIMRLPGTINVPDIKKLKKGRGPALASLIRFTDVRYPIGAFQAAPPKDALTAPSGLQPAAGESPGGAPAGFVARPMPPRSAHINWDETFRLRDSHELNLEALRTRGVQEHALMNLQYGDDTNRLHEQHITIGHRVTVGPFEGFSEMLIATATALRKAGLSVNECAAIMSDTHAGNKHVAKQKDNASKRRAVERALGKAMQDIWAVEERERAARHGLPEWAECFDPKTKLHPIPTMRNAAIAMAAMGITFHSDVFHGDTVGRYDGGEVALSVLVGEITDSVLVRVRRLIIEHYDFDPGAKPTWEAVQDLAAANNYNPVLDMLDEAQRLWEEAGRPAILDTLAVTHWGAEDTILNRTVLAKHILATVKRSRSPGCKYDICLVLEGPQGIGKSSSIKLLVGAENFSDQKILGLNEKQQAEQLRGNMAYEIPELAGLTRSDIEDTKMFMSRSEDKVRKAYGRVVEKAPRTCTFWGSTNDSDYLQDPTGNRRFPPLKCGTIKLDAIKRDRMLILGEASYRVAAGEDINIPSELWGAVAEATEERRMHHPWEELLEHIPQKVLTHDGDGRQEIRVIWDAPVVSEDGHAQPELVEERIASTTLLSHVLSVPLAQQQPFHGRTLSSLMPRAGWTKAIFRIPGHANPYRGWKRTIERSTKPKQPAAKGQGATEKTLIPF